MKICSQRGMSLIEVLLYLGIASSIIVVIAALFSATLQAKARESALISVEQEGTQALTRVLTEIRNANSISLPNEGNSGTSLELVTYDPTKNPLVVDISNGVLQIKEGAQATESLTSDSVAISNFLVQNLSYPGTPGTLRVSFTISANLGVYSLKVPYTEEFIGSATLR